MHDPPLTDDHKDLLGAIWSLQELDKLGMVDSSYRVASDRNDEGKRCAAKLSRGKLAEILNALDENNKGDVVAILAVHHNLIECWG